MSIQTLHLDVSETRHDVYCPSCGARLLAHGGDFGDPCRHLLFGWESISSEYYDPKGGLARLAEAWDREHPDEELLSISPNDA